MSITIDRETIESNLLKDLYDYWYTGCNHHGEELFLPSVDRIDPLTIPKKCLPYVTLLQVNHTPIDLVVRLAGTAIVAYHEKEQRGVRLIDVHSDPIMREICDWYEKSAQEGRALLGNIDFITDAGTLLKSERISLPYVDENQKVTRLLSGIQFDASTRLM